MNRRFVSSVWVCTATAVCSAQQVVEYRSRHFQADVGSVLRIVDLDGDGQRDLIARGPLGYLLFQQVGQQRYVDVAATALPAAWPGEWL